MKVLHYDYEYICTLNVKLTIKGMCVSSGFVIDFKIKKNEKKGMKL